MTAQIGDRIIWQGQRKVILGELFVPPVHPLIRHGEGGRLSSACWRGHVATWEARDGQLLLAGIEGDLELSGGPVPATWVSGVIRVVDGELVQYQHNEYESQYTAVIEIDVACGGVNRSRRLVAEGLHGISGDSPAWEMLPGWSEAFGGSSSSQSWNRPSMDSVPDPRRFRDRALRSRISHERMRRGLRPGQMAAMIGLRSEKGGRLVQWERGQHELDTPKITAMCETFGVSAAEVSDLRARDSGDFEQAWKEWADVPITPALEVKGSLACYAAPASAKEATAVEAWACRCAQIAWRSVVLTLDRRTRVHVDGTGNVVWREACKPGAR